MFSPVLFYSFCSILFYSFLSFPLWSAYTPYRSFETCSLHSLPEFWDLLYSEYMFFAQTSLNSSYSSKTQIPEVRRIYSGFSLNLFFSLRTFASQFLLRSFVRFLSFAPGSVRWTSFCWDIFFPDLIRIVFFLLRSWRVFIPDFLLIYFLWSGMHANAKSGVDRIFSGFYSIFFLP